jgi:general secretion pathway protein H
VKTTTSSTGSSRGFTLLELVVVLVVAAGAAALVLPEFSRMTTLLGLRTNAREVAAALRAARSEAMAQHREVALVVNVEERRYGVAGAKVHRRLRPDVELKLLSAQTEIASAEAGAVRFFPDGSSTGGRVTLAALGQRYVVDVNWLTGRVSLHE